MQVSTVAVQTRQRLWHDAIPSPQHTVAADDNGAETEGARSRKTGKVFLPGINYGEHLVASDPHLTAMLILCRHLHITDGRVQKIR